VPAELIDDEVAAARTTVRPLNLPAEIARYGADRPGLQTVVYNPEPRPA